MTVELTHSSHCSTIFLVWLQCSYTRKCSSNNLGPWSTLHGHDNFDLRTWSEPAPHHIRRLCGNQTDSLFIGDACIHIRICKTCICKTYAYVYTYIRIYIYIHIHRCTSIISISLSLSLTSSRSLLAAASSRCVALPLGFIRLIASSAWLLLCDAPSCWCLEFRGHDPALLGKKLRICNSIPAQG